jgi:alkylation response protein AidB-like acyl-CoA dehydrogenase
MIHWTTEQNDLRDAVHALGEELSAGHIDGDATGIFPEAKWKLLADAGVTALPFGEQHGGLGQDLLTTMYVLESLGYSCRDGGLNFSVSTHLASTGTPLQRFGSADLQRRFLPGVCSGELIGAHAISEPDAGSDAMNMATTAVRADDGSYRLNGNKAFVTNGPIADLLVVYARTGQPGTAMGISTFLVERDTTGLQFGRPMGKMGLNTSPLCEVFLDDVTVPEGNRLGHEGAGFLVLDYVMKREILYGFIINVGEMQYRLEAAIDQAKNRRQFGNPIGSNQAVQNRIVDMAIGVETSRRWLYDTGQKVAAGSESTVDVAISKLIASEASLSSALNAVQIFGGYGYMTEYGFEKDVRNAVAGTIYSGTTEIQKARIAAMLGL